jgi:hypothetical protein
MTRIVELWFLAFTLAAFVQMFRNPIFMTGKYIIVEAQELEWAIVFPAPVSHMAAVNPGTRKVAAGFFEMDEHGEVHVSGFSDSLNLQSRPGDADLIKRSLYFAGVKLPVQTT